MVLLAASGSFLLSHFVRLPMVIPLAVVLISAPLSVPFIRAFEGNLRDEGRSPALTRKVLSSLGGIVAEAQERGLARTNAVRSPD